MFTSVLLRCCFVFVLIWLPTQVQAQVDSVVIKGSRFFYHTNGSEFQIRGVAYEYGDIYRADPLTDGPDCERDVQYLLDLNMNVVSVDNFDPSADHSRCLQAFANAGIYVIASLFTEASFMPQEDPYWDTTLYEQYTGVIDFLASWNNTLGIAVTLDFLDKGDDDDNETDFTTFYITYVKAVLRDLKAYIKAKNYRDLPIGYHTPAFWPTEDDPRDRRVQDYLSCEDTQADFIALELQSCPAEPDIDHIVTLYGRSSVPIWVENLGCGNNTTPDNPRDFNDTAHAFNQNTSEVLVGGVTSEFKWRDDSRLIDDDTGEVVKMPGYSLLSSVMATVTPPARKASQYTPSASSTTACPTSNAAWSVPTILPPTPYSNLCNCMMSTLSCIGKRGAIEPISEYSLQDVFDPLCSTERTNCPGIRASPHEGIFGAYSVCDSTERFSWAASYLMGKNGGSCDYGGNATTQTPNTTVSDECKLLLNQAGTEGTGTVTILSATATTTPSAGARAQDNRPKSGLSTAAKGGIAAGAVVFAVILLISTILILRRRKRKQRSIIPPAELPNHDSGAVKYGYSPAEVGQGAVYETMGKNDSKEWKDDRVAEADGNFMPSELDGNEPMMKIVGPEEPKDVVRPRWMEEK